MSTDSILEIVSAVGGLIITAIVVAIKENSKK